MSDDSNYNPRGIKFVDAATGRRMMYVLPTEPRESLRGWVLYWHPDGQWVTSHKADNALVERLASAAFIDAMVRGKAMGDDLVRELCSDFEARKLQGGAS